MTRHSFAGFSLGFIAIAPLAAQQAPDLAPFMIPERTAEIALARSAAVPAISDSATVLVLTRTGFVEAVHGSNGFTCVVQRSWAGTIGDPDFWNARIRGPSCLNPPATRTVLPEMLKRAEWIMAGVNTTEIASRTDRAYASGQFTPPAAGAMIYMLSSGQYLQDDMPHHWKPHLMFYYEKAMPGATWGATGSTSTIIDATATDPHAHVRVLLIPVEKWSDGKPAM